MKKRFLFLIILIIFMAGCNNKSILLSGESENWEGKYAANINGTREDGEYIFGFKHAKNDTKFNKIEIIINDGETVQNEENHKGTTFRISSSCSGCSVTNEDDSIKVNIKWNDINDETFYLK